VKGLECSARIQVAVEDAFLVLAKSGIVLMRHMPRGELRAELARFSGDNFWHSCSVLVGRANAAMRTSSFPCGCFVGKFIVSGAGHR
jgi:hypothetical protein